MAKWVVGNHFATVAGEQIQTEYCDGRICIKKRPATNKDVNAWWSYIVIDEIHDAKN